MIALGQPFGFVNGLGYGVVSSLREVVSRADGEYEVIVTDMPSDPDSTGVLLDMYGNVMGIVDGKLSEELGTDVLVAYAIKGVKAEIQLMSNGKTIPYAGIFGEYVTEEVSEKQGIPAGLYVNEVEKNSPAMKAGIQCGDIINVINGIEIDSMKTYQDVLNELEAGQTVMFEGQRRGTEGYVELEISVTIGIKE